MSMTRPAFFCAAAMLAFIAPAQAAITYTYNGPLFDAFKVCLIIAINDTGVCTNVANSGTGFQNISAAITLNSPLGSNLSNASINPIAWSIRGSNDFSLSSIDPIDSNHFITNRVFSFSTDASGSINGWNIQLVYLQNVPGGGQYQNSYVTTGANGVVSDFARFASTTGAATFSSVAPQANVSKPFGSPALWTANSLTATPEPATLATVLFGIGAIVAIKRRRE